ncbi:hypothetical protein M3650_03800 [Paenibacillus sp. MER TA 81-3]|uniref:hypothetical protein n=1 Tax=Paenibacillus sp. MER TA 81-3 TaxID=2939573 RepID=UPI00203A5944|nr:hypothetical protein [Paenibacillus sp. MER TA 81-3]MCM3337780.1 hypothetical protein [Paenibacillus sp. MER TA 81-3]
MEVIVNGKRDRKQKETKSYPTAKEAYDAGILIEADKQRGKLVDEKNITLGALPRQIQVTRFHALPLHLP